jgi:hypothetical protein
VRRGGGTSVYSSGWGRGSFPELLWTGLLVGGAQPTARSACNQVVLSPFADGLGGCAALIGVMAAGGELAPL